MKKVLTLLLVMAIMMTSCGRDGAVNSDAEASVSESIASVSNDETEGNTEEESDSPDSEEKNSEDADSEDNAADAAAENQEHYPVTLIDQAGREVVIEDEPQKLVSGYYISTSLLIALDLEEKLVGIEARADKRAIYSFSAPELINLPSVGSAKEFDLEGCAALEPDLVILPLKLESSAQTLEDLGMDVLLVNPENQELLTEMINLIASATDTEERAQELLNFTAAQEKNLSQTLADADVPDVYLAGNSSMLSTAGGAMYQSDMVRLAGGNNVAAEITDTYWAEISYEQLLAWNPEYIILASDADYSVEDVLTDPNLADCAAVVNQQVYQMPGKAEAWDSPVPSGILGAVWLSGILHPDLCLENECAALIDEYYEKFYGFIYSEN